MVGLLAVGCGVLGVVVGSFLNVVIYRVPRKESIVSPRSRCPGCGTMIAERDNIPVVSWLVLRGRCRTCKMRISARYPLVEASTGLLFAGLALRYGFDAALPAFLCFIAGLLALACIDFDCRLLPRAVVYPHLAIVAVLLVVAAAGTGNWHALAIAAACSAAWFALFFVINFASPRMMGFGDVRLALVLGLGLGWLGVPVVLVGFFAANLFGAVVGIYLIARKQATRETAVPYGVFLAMGAAFALYLGPVLHLHFRGG